MLRFKHKQDLRRGMMNKYKGLTEIEAKKRIETYGLNEIKEEKKTVFVLIFQKFWGPIPWILELTIIITLLLKKYPDSIAIFILLVFNAFVSFFYELSSFNALNLLKKHLSIKAKVLRDSTWKEIDSKFLTVGDIVSLQKGFAVPADVKILEGVIMVDQSSITGESLSKSLKSGDVAFMGSFVLKGDAIGEVINIGENTIFGKSAKLLKEAKTKSQLEQIVFNLVKYLFIFGVVLMILIFIISLSEGSNLLEFLPVMVIMLIPIIPAALPAAFTLTTALGAKELAKEGVLVNKLSALESAASMDVLCTDKTGTITKNKISIEKIVPVGSYSEKDVLCYAAIASDIKEKDPIEEAIFNKLSEKCYQYEKVSFEPFEPSAKYSYAVIKENNRVIKVYKGSPKVAPISNKAEEEVYRNMAKSGLRVLAVWIDIDGIQKIVGFIGFLDPPREDSKELIAEIKNLGIDIKMITGDTKETALYIAKIVGINDNVCEAKNIKDSCGVFAEVLPEDKFNIVKVLQNSGHTVGMTGDGLNDAPALKQADVGIAVANATDVAKDAASIVLTNEGLVNIKSAIIISRKIYQRLLTYIFTKTIRVFTITLTIFFFYLTTKEFILTTKMLISLIFYNDFLTLSLATDNVGYSKKPDKWDIKKISIVSLMFGIFSFVSILAGVYLIGYKIFNLNLESLRTITFLALVLNIPLSIFSLRVRDSIKETKPPSFLLTFFMLIAILGSNFMAYYGIFIKSIMLDVILSVDLYMLLVFLMFDKFKKFVFKMVRS